MKEIVVDHICLLGEGTLWDTRRQSVCWIDILRGEIHEYHPATHEFKTISLHQMVGSIAVSEDGNFIAALKNGFAKVHRHSGEVRMIFNPEPHLPGNRFNDGKCDPAGRFWAGTMSHTDEPGKGSLYVLDEHLAVTKKMENVSISNGMAWSGDQETFYYIDTPTFSVAAFRYDQKNAKISEKRIVVQVPVGDGSPDGMTIDQEGMLWIAHWDGWQVTRWNPGTGKKILSIPFPAARVTCCCFGGPDFQDLYVSTARNGLSEEQLNDQPLAGSLFVIKDVGYKGLAAFEFNG